jgi:hypothetical protein
MAAAKGPARSRQREEFWRRIVTRQPKSGLSIRAWCARHGVTEASFYAWRRTLARRGATVKNSPARLVAVDVTGGANTFIGSASLQLVVNDFRVEIGTGFDGETLRRLVGVLREAVPC